MTRTDIAEEFDVLQRESQHIMALLERTVAKLEPRRHPHVVEIAPAVQRVGVLPYSRRPASDG